MAFLPNCRSTGRLPSRNQFAKALSVTPKAWRDYVQEHRSADDELIVREWLEAFDKVIPSKRPAPLPEKPPGVSPSTTRPIFDDKRSFILNIDSAVNGVRMETLANLMNQYVSRTESGFMGRHQLVALHIGMASYAQRLWTRIRGTLELSLKNCDRGILPITLPKCS